jgi:hypothetical protein
MTETTSRDTFLAQLARADEWLTFAPSLPDGVNLTAASTVVAQARAAAEGLNPTEGDAATRLARLRAAVEAVLGLELDDASWTTEP